MTNGTSPSGLQPHRGTLLLILGILALVCGCIGIGTGIAAWVMGNSDLKAMAEGRMDPAGEGMTKAGKICGMIGVILQVVGGLIYAVFAFLVVSSGAMHAQ